MAGDRWHLTTCLHFISICPFQPYAKFYAYGPILRLGSQTLFS